MIVQNIGHTLKNKQKQQVWLYSWDYTINRNEKEDEIKTKQKNSSYRYDKNRPRFRDGHKCIKSKEFLSMITLICIKQHLSNIWSSIYEKINNNETELKKSVAYKKKRLTSKS